MKSFKEKIELPTKKMIAHFEKRTKAHIEKVQKNINILIGKIDVEKKDLIERSKNHDLSKFSEDEKMGYVWMTDHFANKTQYSEKTKKMVDDAWDHHKSNNPHHPEFHQEISKMSNVDIAEMVCDVVAMSQEFGDDPKKFLENNQLKKFDFSKEQTTFIFKVVNALKVSS